MDNDKLAGILMLLTAVAAVMGVMGVLGGRGEQRTVGSDLWPSQVLQRAG